MADITSTLFNINVATNTPKTGSLLVAEPFLREEYFNHAVISLIDYEEGKNTMGIVLNRYTGYSLGEIVDEIDDRIDLPVFCGGPMSSDRLFYIHTLGTLFPGCRPIGHGLYVGGDFDEITRYIQAGYPTDGFIRFFIGYSGWDAGQLELELKDHVWAVSDHIDRNTILTGEEDSYWHRTVRTLGPDYRGWLYHPMDVHAN